MASRVYVCRAAGTPARRNSSHATASRICAGSFYIDLMFSRLWPTSRSSSSPGSTFTFHDLFGAYLVLLPLLTSEKVDVVNSAPASCGGGAPRVSPGSARHRLTRASPVASTGSSGRISLGGQSVIETWYIDRSKKPCKPLEARRAG